MSAPPPQSDDPLSAATPERQAADSFLCAVLLGFVGGSLDAFLWLSHGNVFAGAMTGNAVLCGIALLSHNSVNALHHAVPILAFLCGIWLAEVLAKHLRHHAVTVGLACECMGLLIASFLPLSFPNLLFNPFIALLAAYQVASFRKVDRFSYNSTFISGDLRAVIVGLYEALDPAGRVEGLRQARSVGSVVISFIAGAVAGAVLAPRLGNHALWLPTAVLAVVLVLAWRRALATIRSTQVKTE